MFQNIPLLLLLKPPSPTLYKRIGNKTEEVVRSQATRRPTAEGNYTGKESLFKSMNQMGIMGEVRCERGSVWGARVDCKGGRRRKWRGWSRRRKVEGGRRGRDNKTLRKSSHEEKVEYGREDLISTPPDYYESHFLNAISSWRDTS